MRQALTCRVRVCKEIKHLELLR